MSERNLRIARYALIVLGLSLLGLNIFLGQAVDITLPLVFLMLGAGFLLLVFAVSRASPWGALFYIPAALLTAFGIIFLFNVITNDWNSWAYAWLLLVAGAGVGLALTTRQMGWRRVYLLAGVGMAAGGVTFFALFGAIAGGLFIRVIAPVLLVLGGLALYWIRPEWLPLRKTGAAAAPSEMAAPTGLAAKELPGAAPTGLAAVTESPAVTQLPSPIEMEAAAELAAGELPAAAPFEKAGLSEMAAAMELPAAPTGLAATELPGANDPPVAGVVEPLSPRELDVLRLIDQGFSNGEIAVRLVLAQSTVKSHINSIYGKLGVQTRVQAINRSRDLGLL